METSRSVFVNKYGEDSGLYYDICIVQEYMKQKNSDGKLESWIISYFEKPQHQAMRNSMQELIDTIDCGDLLTDQQRELYASFCSKSCKLPKCLMKLWRSYGAHFCFSQSA